MDIQLWDGRIPAGEPAADTPNHMTMYRIPASEPRPAVIVLPGGGYAMRAEHEGEPIARFYNTCGCQAFVVHYRVAPHRFPAALLDVQRAIRLVRYHAAEWQVDPTQVFILGFSAGGHLAASAMVWEELETGADAVGQQSARPDGGILCYPVISAADGVGHKGSWENLLGAGWQEKKAAFSLEERVCAHTPPAFIWHTGDDPVVPVENSLRFAAALWKHGVSCELHVFPHGPHGLGLAEASPDVCQWPALSATWLRQRTARD